MARFRLAPSAQNDLDEIWRYISENNETAAEKFIRELSRTFELLAENKEIGTRQDDFLVTMRMFPFKSYQIYYFASETGVEIYRVLHGRRNIEGLFEELPK